MLKKLVLIIVPFVIHAQSGVVASYYDNGKAESEITYNEGVREGEAKFYYPNGNLKEERFYVNGRVDGLVKVYSDSGKILELVNLEYGKRNGPVSLFNSQGEYLTDVYYEDGMKLVIPEPSPEPVKETVQKDVVPEQKKEPVIQVKKKSKSESEMPLPPVQEEAIFDDDPAYYLSVEVMPEPVGGMENINRRLHYPGAAAKRKLEGTVKVLAFIDEYGVVEKAEVIEKLGFGCDEAAQTTVYYTKFKPGLLRGRPIKVQMVIPIEFKLKEPQTVKEQ